MKLFLYFVLLPTVSLARKVPDVRRTPQITPPEEWKPVKTINEILNVMSDDSISAYIISGNAAYQGQFPWQALLIMDKSVLCGGSLISDKFVLTAAHCLEGHSSISVSLGNIKNPPEETSDVTTFTTTEKIIHEEYSDQVNDIGLVKFAAIGMTEFISTVRLAPRSYQSESLVGSIVVATGYGKTSDSSNAGSDTLMYVSLKVISNSECASYFNVFHIKFDESIMCTLGPSSNPTGSNCNGDSGGALVMKSADGIYNQVGIVAFGSSKGCSLQYPSGYTRVSNYLDWIEQNTGITIN